MMKIHTLSHVINLGTQQFKKLGKMTNLPLDFHKMTILPLGPKIDFYHIFSLTKPSRSFFILKAAHNSHYFTHLSPIL